MADTYGLFKSQIQKLTSRVTELEDAYLKMKRMYEDAINNIDNENFSTSYTKQLTNEKNQISYNFEKVNDDLTTVKSEFQVTAEEIKSSVTKVKDGLEETKTEFSQTADEIKISVERVDEKFKNYSTVEQTANGIQSVVGMSFADGIVNIAKFKENTADTSKVYFDGQMYHYYNGTKWCESEQSNIFSSFSQSNTGFKFTGDVQTTTNSGTQVDISGTKIDIYKNGMNIPKLSMGFSDGSSGSNPIITLGAGDGSGSTTIDAFTTYRGQGVIHKFDSGLSMYYYGNVVNGSNTYPGVYMYEDGTVNIVGSNITFNGSTLSATAVFG